MCRPAAPACGSRAPRWCRPDPRRILDPHPAIRAGLEAILRDAAGIVGVGAVADRHALLPLLYRAGPRCAWRARRTATVGAPRRELAGRKAAILPALRSGAAIGPLDRAGELHSG